MISKYNLIWVFCAVFLVVFNIVFFVTIGTSPKAPSIISYVFVHIACVSLFVTPFFVNKNEYLEESNFSLYLVSILYFFATFVSSIFFILVNQQTFELSFSIIRIPLTLNLDTLKTSFSLQCIITGIYVVAFAFNVTANKHTAYNINVQKKELEYVKTATFLANNIMQKVSDTVLKKEVEKLYDLFKSSPYKSNSNAKDYETKVLELTRNLNDSLESKSVSEINEIIKNIKNYANTRNSIL